MGRLFNKIVRKVTSLVTGELSQELNGGLGEGKCVVDGIGEKIRQAAAEGCVLLKNNGVLPLKNKKISVFGRCQHDYFFVGYGSGGDVKAPYKVNLYDGLKNGGVEINEEVSAEYKRWAAQPKNVADEGFWGHWPYSFPEMPLKDEFVSAAANNSDIAVVVIGRAAGEDRENKLKKGSYYLTDKENDMLRKVTSAFRKTVVILDVGNVIDFSWVKEYGKKISAILLVWQGGMESGNAICDVLTGKVNPCGKLTDTIAEKYEDYPSSPYFGNRKKNCYVEDIFVGYRYFETFAKEKVLFPFGYGLSYTDFNVRSVDFNADDKNIECSFVVKNIGKCSGSYVLELYCRQPQGKLGKAERVLAGFEKTKVLEPGEEETVSISVLAEYIASYDDTGKSGYEHSYVLEKGKYEFLFGDSCRCTEIAGEYFVENTFVVRKTEKILPINPNDAYLRMVNENGSLCYEQVPIYSSDLKERILRDLPEEENTSADGDYRLSDVADGRITLKKFISTLNDKELECLTRGEGAMNSPYGTAGNAGAFGGTMQSLTQKGIPPIITTDGPAGIRLKKTCALLPCGTSLACTWNKELIKELFSLLAEEMKHYGSDVILSPGMNVHRNPLCGRNFEYYSEDPVVSGIIAKYAVIGIQSNGKSACPKHFACNNQETNRQRNDSVVSERALREIYLRGFEIVVKEAKPNTIMTSYNKINGVWSHYNYDLCTTVLRNEWGFDGVVMTDWWMQYASSSEFPKIKSNGYRVRSQVDVLMPGVKRLAKNTADKDDGTLTESLGKEGGITYGEIKRSVNNVLNFIIKTKFIKK